MVKRARTEVIQAEDLCNGHALAFDNQPYLTELFDEARRPNSELVVVAGAGVSMDAGLPSWRGLIENVRAKFLKEDVARPLALMEGGNLQRQAMAAFTLAKDASRFRTNHEMVREALFHDGDVPAPRNLASGIAQLAESYKQATRILTLNYDPLLEYALEGILGSAASYSLDGDGGARCNADAWAALSASDRRTAVLHLHGKVPVEDGEELLGPLILSEADYAAHGPAVIEQIATELTGRTSIFVGLSLTDPNLIGALHRIKRHASGQKVFALIVPQLQHPDLTREECADIATRLAGVLEREWDLKPILLKTYAQVAQVVFDLALAAVYPKPYRLRTTSKRPDELRYGVRFGAALRQTYSLLGADRKGVLSSSAAADTSKFMHDAMKAKRGPVNVLETMRRAHKGKSSTDEKIALFLWLRDLEDLRERSFGLRLVTASAYTHWEPWSSVRVEAIEEGSRYAAVEAVFSSQTVAMNLKPEDRAGVWRGSFAVPLWLYGFRNGSPLDALLLGAASINTTALIRPEDGRVTPSEEMSILSVADEDEIDDFAGGIIEVVSDLLNRPRR